MLTKSRIFGGMIVVIAFGFAIGLAVKLGVHRNLAQTILPVVPRTPLFDPASRGRLNAVGTESALSFEPNRGQTDPAVKFLARANGYNAYLTSTGATFVFSPSDPQRAPRMAGRGSSSLLQTSRDAQPDSSPTVLHMSLMGANPAPELSGEENLPGHINYLSGSRAENWHIDIPAFARVLYRSVYPGNDLTYYGTRGQLEYDFILQPGADPGLVRLKYDDASSVHVDRVGDLVLRFGNREVKQKKALIYQERGGRRQKISGKYKLLASNEVGVEIGPYDVARPLVIDPALVYLAVFGSPANGQLPAAMATDANGNVYVTGTAFGPDFPTTPGALQTSGPGGLNEIFVSKLSADGKQLLYSTYLGGFEFPVVDDGLAIAVDPLGQAYVVGDTSGLNFPTTPSGFQTSAGSCPNPDSYCDGFLTVLNASGSGLVYSTYVGGTDQDRVQGVALDPNGNVYLTGQTVSTDFPTTPGAYLTSIPPTLHSHTWVFITKIDPSKSGSASLIYSTYVGGIISDGTGIAVDASGAAYVVGGVSGDGVSYPTTPGAFQPKIATSEGRNAFVTKMNPAGTALVYSTFLGGSTASPSVGSVTSDLATGVAVDSDGNAYVTGGATSIDFPTTAGAFQPTLAGVNAAFISKLNPSGSALVYSTLLGGSTGFEEATVGNSIAIDRSQNAYIVGTTDSDDFPTSSVTLEAVCGRGTCAAQPSNSPSPPRNGPNAFVTELNPSGSSLVFSTFFGVTGAYGSALGLDTASGNIIITGAGGGLPATPGAFSTPSSLFVARISQSALGAAIALAPGAITFPTQAIGTSTQQMATLTSRGNAPLAISGISLTGSGYTQTNDCPSTLPLLATCSLTISFEPTQETTFTGQLMVADNALGSPHVIYLGGSGGTSLLTLSASSLTFPSEVLSTPSAAQTIMVTNAGTAQIQFGGITSTGDFSQTNTCVGSVLSIGNSCTISIVFTPTAAGSRTGTITLVDNAPNSPQTVALGGTGVDFAVSAASSSATVNAGQAASYMLNISPTGGFNHSVSLACSGAPPAAQCTVSPSTVTPSGANAATATVTVSTTARSALFPFRWISFPKIFPQLTGAACTIFLLFLLAMWFGRTRKRIALGLCLAVLAGCGGGASSSGSSAGGGSTPSGTPAGTYNLKVAATSGGTTRTTTLQLIVN